MARLLVGPSSAQQGYLPLGQGILRPVTHSLFSALRLTPHCTSSIRFPPQIFDPLGLSDGAAPGEIKKWREAEIKHGRVAMLAALGVIVAEVSNGRRCVV